MPGDGLGRELGPAFGDLVEVVGGDVGEGLVAAAGPGDLDRGDGGGVAEAEVGAEIALGEVAASTGDFADLIDASRGDFDSGAQSIAIRFCSD